MTRAPTAVLIHGAWAGGWVWTAVAAELASAGFPVAVVDLPGAPASQRPSSEADLDGNVTEVVRRVADIDGPLVLVGHSGGGITVTATAERLAERVASVVYVAGILLPSEVGFAELVAEAATESGDGDGIAPYLVEEEGPSTVVPPEAGVAILFQNASPDDAIAASRMLSRQLTSGLAMAATWTEHRFGRIPRWYLETTEDRCIPIGIQRFMQARTPGSRLITLVSDHTPQLSLRKPLVEALISILAAPAEECSATRHA